MNIDEIIDAIENLKYEEDLPGIWEYSDRQVKMFEEAIQILEKAKR